MEYWIADSVLAIVNDYLKFHADLIGANIGCLFKEKASTSDGAVIVGKISKVSEKYKALMSEPYDFMIEIGMDAWKDLDNAQKEAWVDHLMEHAYGEEDDTTGDMKWKMRKPEIQLFPIIINRHGINWQDHLPKVATLPVTVGTIPDEPQVRKSSDDETAKFDALTSDLN